MALKLFASKKAPAAGVETSTIIETSPRQPAPAAAVAAPAAPVGGRLRAYGLLFAIFATGSAALLVYQLRSSALATLQVSAASELQTLSQQIAKSAQLARHGNAAAVTELKQTRARFTELLQTLDAGGPFAGTTLPPAPGETRPALQALGEAWRQTAASTAKLAEQGDIFVALGAAVSTINTDNAPLFASSDALVRSLLANGAHPDMIAAAYGVITHAQRAAGHANALMLAETPNPEVAATLAADADRLRALLGRLKQSSAGTMHANLVGELEADAGATLLAVNSIVAGTHPLMQAKEAASNIARDSVPLLARSAAVSDALTRSASGFGALHVGAAVSALLALLALLLMARSYGADAAARRLETEQQRQRAEDERNLTQQAILRLMNEMGDLADGDLTIRATVTEDITGAIADSRSTTPSRSCRCWCGASTTPPRA